MTKSQSYSDSDIDSLFASARADRPDTSAAEFAFETRLMARLLAAKSASEAVWATVCWRSIPFCAAVVVALALWNSAVASATDDAEIAAYFENPDIYDLWLDQN